MTYDLMYLNDEQINSDLITAQYDHPDLEINLVLVEWHCI